MSEEKPKPGQQESDEFHMMLGYCIAAWADVDDLLFRIFRDCVGPTLQCAIIYYKTPGLEARFSLTDEIVRSVLPKKKPGAHDHPSVKTWDKTIKVRQELLAMRRRIAHHPVTMQIKYSSPSMFGVTPLGRMRLGASVERISSSPELYATQHEKLRRRSADLPALRLKDLEDHLIAVGALADGLLRFLIEVLSVLLSKPSKEPSSPNTQGAR
jgi:hypothetical protein